MISIAYTPSDIDPKALCWVGDKQSPCAHQVRRYIENIGSWAKAKRIVKKLISEGHYDIFIDKYDRDNDLIAYKGFNQLT